MSLLVFNLFDCLQFNQSVFEALEFTLGECDIHSFPDQELLVKINIPVNDREIVFVADLYQPNAKILPLLFAVETARALGAKKVHLFTPYLPYMRQDKQFKPNEGITSAYFAKLISHYFDSLVTFEPHLHRWHSLDDIYTIPSTVLHAHDSIATWIKQTIENPVLIGPDRESEQWVSKVAYLANAPYVIFDKIRHSDKDVSISGPSIAEYQNYTAVIIDDVISTGRTMIKIINHLKSNRFNSIICLGVHALFVEDSYDQLSHSGVDTIVTCNTVSHPTNAIDLSNVLLNHFENLK